ncbi:polyprenyl synthetase family protein [Clostridium sp. CM028]|uniref:polyprenyl synthetase family protein n=1 Tax=unclassified Clostridium TaxID=2614128 RepID=UPI001C0B9A77|nr:MULTISPECIES: farnesyl diphosphate synthase [unclassified Clostridium]MBU3091558.1 polyprenyl synthetase family protein [Clostridium sp. CF011]MBW9144178.1 polyprenyl synthetase family protein [Clostridium sp. CM027]MBW9147512.1 polyprenyl synthetase family protein [Clostridium sp. CM028]UVE42575.1 polyprenyl synthetase family protein [Clostridium sp. CM027]WAG71528.1 polyprenyl synthetase family protein [Clostridium sp. CF011]
MMNIKLLKDVVEHWINDYFDNKPEIDNRNFESMIYSIKVGGKRVRPILMILTYNMYKEDYRDILPFAAALEMIHTYSLIHDDLPSMDNDDLRRGKPTNHKIYGEAIAILAGDGLLNEAMIIMLNQCLDGSLNKIKASAFIAKASGAQGMIAGQICDILSEGIAISEEELLYMHRNKTGELIKVAIICGAILGNASEEELSELKEYGDKLGLAFQIKDDILDVIGDVSVLGKNVKSDECNNKTTFITMYGLEKCKEKCNDLSEECFEILKNLKVNTKYLEEMTEFLLKREY